MTPGLPVYLQPMGGPPAAGGYSQKVLDLFGANTVGYWPLWEPNGPTANDISGNGFHGTQVGNVLWDNGGIGDGRTSAWFHSTGDAIDLLGAGLTAAFNGSEGSIMIWAKVNTAAVWSDGANRFAFNFFVDPNNQVNLSKVIPVNTLQYLYTAGAAAELLTSVQSYTAWFHLAVTWTKSGDAMKAFINASQVTPTQTGLGVWAGSLTRALIGAQTNLAASCWHGYLAHAVLLNRVATPAELTIVNTVP